MLTLTLARAFSFFMNSSKSLCALWASISLASSSMATIQFFNSLFIRDGPFRLFWEDVGVTCIKEHLYLWFHDTRFMPDGVLMGYTH